MANRLGGRLTGLSGGGDEKADGRVMRKFRIENKGTAQKRYRISYKEWDKLWIAAMDAAEDPIFHVHIDRDSQNDFEYAVMETHLFEAVFDIELGENTEEVTQGIFIKYTGNLIGSQGPIPEYRRYKLQPVWRKKPHDVVLTSWWDVMGPLHDYRS